MGANIAVIAMAIVIIAAGIWAWYISRNND